MALIVDNKNITQSMRETYKITITTIKELQLKSKDFTSSLMFKSPLPRPSFVNIFVSVPSKMPYAEYGRKIKALAHDISTVQQEVHYGDKKAYEHLFIAVKSS